MPDVRVDVSPEIECPARLSGDDDPLPKTKSAPIATIATSPRMSPYSSAPCPERSRHSFNVAGIYRIRRCEAFRRTIPTDA